MTATAGDYDAGKVLTLTLNMSEAVDVTGTPTLTLNDGGTASYVSGSGSNALVFSYTVAAGQNTAALQATAVTGTITDLAGNALSTSSLPQTLAGVIVNTTGPTISAIAESPSSGDLDAGKTVTLTLDTSEVVTVNTTGGSPTLSLNDGGTATYVSGSGTSALTFSYTVGAGQNTSALAATAVNLNSATITDGAGNAANLSLTGLTQTGPKIDTTAPTVSSVTATAGDYDAGKVLTLTLNMSEAVNVTGTPTLTLNDGGTASYVSGSGSSALVFSYTVGAGQNIAALAGNRGHRHHRRPRRQCAEHRRPARNIYRRCRRHHDADDQRDCGIAVERRPQCRQDRHLHPYDNRSGDGQYHGRHADADAERWQHRDL